ncbi:endonuclease III [Candidatus Sumerlaeota bacterium]|nr:endonuclease III [Candidatus Sumerlaeota bacterium]
MAKKKAMVDPETIARKAVAALKREYDGATCALEHQSALQLLIATILSAQCTDARVNLVTKELFRKYRDAQAFVKAPQEELEQDVRSTGFYRNKAKSIKGACLKIVEDFGGEVPGTMDELLTLPGVARKTANVVLGTWFGKNEGVVVDTHVKRISGLLGMSRESSPEKIEQELMRLIPREEWTNFSHQLIWHGRKVCVARRPKCCACMMSGFCPSAMLSP